MKKLFALLLAAMMLLGCVALAESAIDPETVADFDRESNVTTWEGEWVLVGAYLGEDYAADLGLDVSGVLEVPENAATMTVAAVLDGSATGSDAGVMVDQGNYWHAHVYDMDATITFAAEIADDTANIYLPWDGWNFVVRGEGDGDFNAGVGKLNKVTCEDKSLYFGALTGVESEDIADEKVRYVGMNTAGQLIVCYSDDNLVKKDGEIAFGLIFARVAE